MMSRMRTTRGFSLVEIAIVLAIAGVLIAIIVPRMQSYIDRNRVAQAIVEIGEMSTKIRQDEVSKAMLPDTLDDVGYGGRVGPWKQPLEDLHLGPPPPGLEAAHDKSPNTVESHPDP